MMTTQTFRVLVVEDFAGFRQFISSIFAERRDLQVVGEASDGLEAVQKAGELEPDLESRPLERSASFPRNLK